MTATNVYAVNTTTYHSTVADTWFIKLCGIAMLGKKGKKVKTSLNTPSDNGKNIPENIAVACTKMVDTPAEDFDDNTEPKAMPTQM